MSASLVSVQVFMSVSLCGFYLAAALPPTGYRPPAGTRAAIRGANGAAILPGGRALQPLGLQLPTGPGPFALAASPSGRILATANLGPERSSLTILESDKRGKWLLHNVFTSLPGGRDSDFSSLSAGLAFATERTLWVAEGDSGRVRLIDLTGARKRTLDLNTAGLTGSFAGKLAFDRDRGLLYVLDPAHFRLVVFDTAKPPKTGDESSGSFAISSVETGFLPDAICLSPDGRRAWIANAGLARYHTLPGIPFPPFGFPSAAAAQALGAPDPPESHSVLALDLSHPEAPQRIGFVRTGSPGGLLAANNAVYVSNAYEDTVDVLDPQSNTIHARIPLGLPGLENLRGVIPLGMAFDESHHWLFVAEAGINAVGVIDTKTNQEIALLPAGWYPSAVSVSDGALSVTNVKGSGAGPSSVFVLPDSEDFAGVLRRGSVSHFPLPDPSALPQYTGIVLAAGGLRPVVEIPKPAIPIHHVVIIVKEKRTFDEVFGDISKAANGEVAGLAPLARFGSAGYARGGKARFSLQSVDVTPNQHQLAKQFAFSDNFYADSDGPVDGHHWTVGAYPDGRAEASILLGYVGQQTFILNDALPGRLLFAGDHASVLPEEQPLAGSLWQHLDRAGISFRNFGEGFDLSGNLQGSGEEPTGARLFTNIPMPDALFRNTSRQYPGFNLNIGDQYRSAQFIQDLENNYRKTGAPLPHLLFLDLPNDSTGDPRPRAGYPYEASYVADNDVALGKIVQYLSHSPWWNDMAIFVTESGPQGSRDHVDAHRTLLLGIGPYFRRNYCSHVNASFPSILKTTFRLLGAPPLNLFDATASDLDDMFTADPDFSSFDAKPSDPRLFDSLAIPERSDAPTSH